MNVDALTILMPQGLAGEAETLRAGLDTHFEHGVGTVIYDSADEAMRLISGQRTDLLVVKADAEGGLHRALLAVARQSRPEVPVVAVVEASFPPGRRHELARAVYDFLTLPLVQEEAFVTLRNALQWRQTRCLLQNKEQELLVLDEIGRTIISSLELKTVLNIIMEKTRELVQSEAWSLLLIDEKTEELHCSVAIGEHAANLRQFKMKLGEGVAGWVAREGKPMIVHDVSEDPRFFNEMDLTLGFQTNSILCVPLETRGKILGVLEVINKKGEGKFSDGDLNLVTKLAGFAAVAIENARLYHQAKLLTLTDELTHLYNSRFFNQFLESEVKRCRRYDSSVSLIFLDLDFFKKVNDQYGHLMGSRLLQEAADVLREGLRDVDIVARYGGDEFLVILPETKIDEAGRVAERMRVGFEKKTFLAEEGLDVKVTASFGVASFPDSSSSKEELVRMADQAMYHVKNKSRNGVFIADNPSAFEAEEEGKK